MRRFAFASLLVWIVPSLALAGDVDSEDPGPLISNGTPAENCQWPTAVLLQNGGSLCSGTLVHPRVVLSAGHCLSDASFPSKIRFGESMQAVQQDVQVEFCMRSPTYQYPDVNGEDYSFCKLAEPVYDVPITPVVYGCETSILQVNQPAMMVGFGNNEGDTGAGTKRYSMSTIQSPVSADSTHVYVGEVGNAPCSGDSGGPAYVQYPDGSWHAFGIVSGGPPCGAGADLYALMHPRVPWIEEMSGVDITPCFDQDGTWNPTPLCDNFATDPYDTAPNWADWCVGSMGEPSATCGDPYDSVDDTTPPTVEITYPLDGTVFEDDPSSMDIEIDAEDEGWGILEIRLEINGDEVATDEFEPYIFKNAAFPKGGYVLRAIAEDWAGNVTESEPVAIAIADEVPEVPDDPDPTEGETDDPDDPDDTDDTDDTGDLGASGDDRGCGCSAPGNNGAGFGAIVLLTFMGIRRRRRQQARA